MQGLQDGTRMNSQTKVQNEINLHNQKKRAVSASRMQVECKWCGKFSKNSLKHKLYMTHNF
jgi:hypothetical protein